MDVKPSAQALSSDPCPGIAAGLIPYPRPFVSPPDDADMPTWEERPVASLLKLKVEGVGHHLLQRLVVLVGVTEGGIGEIGVEVGDDLALAEPAGRRAIGRSGRCVHGGRLDDGAGMTDAQIGSEH